MDVKQYYKELRKQGKTDKDAIKLVCKKFDLKKSDVEMILNF